MRTVSRVTERVRRFDDYLNRLLEELAREAGENVETYVARAVATQMANDMRRANDPAVDELQAHLSDSGVLEKTAMPDVTSVITDPDRLSALRRTGLLDSPPEAIYDRITRAAADALDAPYATLTLVDEDRQFFKSAVGLDTGSPGSRQTSLERSVCQYAVADGAQLVLEDARLDPTFKQHPAVRDGSVVACSGPAHGAGFGSAATEPAKGELVRPAIGRPCARSTQRRRIPAEPPTSRGLVEARQRSRRRDRATRRLPRTAPRPAFGR